MLEREQLLIAEDHISMAARRVDGLQHICYELTNARSEDESVWSIFEEALRICRDDLREALSILRGN